MSRLNRIILTRLPWCIDHFFILFSSRQPDRPWYVYIKINYFLLNLIIFIYELPWMITTSVTILYVQLVHELRKKRTGQQTKDNNYQFGFRVKNKKLMYYVSEFFYAVTTRKGDYSDEKICRSRCHLSSL